MLTLSYILESSLDQLKPLLVKGVKSRIDDYELEKDLLPYFKKVGKELIFLVYDPILVVGNPADNYNIHLKEKRIPPPSWVLQEIQTILELPHIIEKGVDVNEQIRNSGLDRWESIKDRFRRLHIRDSSILAIIENFIQNLLQDQFQIHQVRNKSFTMECLSVAPIRIPAKINNNKTNQTLEFLIQAFNLIVDIKVDKTGNVRTFGWLSSKENLEMLYDYLAIQKLIIATISFELFAHIFDSIPIGEVTTKIIWQDKAKNGHFNDGLLVDMIYSLSEKGFIDKLYLNPKDRNPILESCFGHPDGSTVRVVNKKVTSIHQKATKKLIIFRKFLDTLPEV